MIAADELSGQEVLGLGGNRLGTIDEVRMTPQGQVQDVVISRGGVLGMGEDRISLAWDRIRTTPEGDLVADISEAELSQLPGVD